MRSNGSNAQKTEIISFKMREKGEWKMNIRMVHKEWWKSQRFDASSRLFATQFCIASAVAYGRCMCLHLVGVQARHLNKTNGRVNGMHYPNAIFVQLPLFASVLMRNVFAENWANEWVGNNRNVGLKSIIIIFPSFRLCSFVRCLSAMIACETRVDTVHSLCTQFNRSCLPAIFLSVRFNGMYEQQTHKSISFLQINTFLNYKFSISRQLIINNFPCVCSDVFEWSMAMVTTTSTATTTAMVHYLLQVSSSMNLISSRDAGHIRPNRRKVSKI